MFARLHKNIQNYGSFTKIRRCRTKTVTHEDNSIMVLSLLCNSPHISLRAVSGIHTKYYVNIIVLKPYFNFKL